jgi:hypothetical protein
LVGNGTLSTFGSWYDFRQKMPLGVYARFYAECLEEIGEGDSLGFAGGRLPGVTLEQVLINMRLFASDVIPRVRDAVKL